MKKLLSLIALWLFVTCNAMAAQEIWKWRLAWNNAPYDTPEAACTKLGTDALYQPTYPVKINDDTYQCHRSSDGSPVAPSVGNVVKTFMGCTEGKTPDYTKPKGEWCGPATATCVAGRTHTGTYERGTDTVTIPWPQQVGGCLVDVIEITACRSGFNAVGVKDYECDLLMQETGQPAPAGTGGGTPGGSPPNTKPDVSPPMPPKPDGSCPKGTMQIGTDSAGTAICAGQGSNPGSPPTPPKVEKPPVTTQNPDGTTTETKTTEQKNADGSTTTTTTKTTTGADGTKTTTAETSTGNSSSGAPGKRDDTPEDKKDDFCKQHPELNICKNSSISGQCEQTSCQGDAITCEIARQNRKLNCDIKASEDLIKAKASYTLGGQLEAGNDPMNTQIQNMFKGTEVDLSSQNLSQAGFLGGGSCFPTRTISAAGHSVTVNFASVCSNISALRFAIIACSMIVAYMLVSKSVLQG